MRRVLQLSLAFAALGLAQAGPAAGEGKTVLIIDATAQMSAKLGQVRKIDAVKRAAGDAASRMDPQSPLAVWAFGTDPARKCEDKAVLVPLQPAGTAARALDKALSPVQPKAGRAPVFGTLEAALSATGEPKDAAILAVVVAGTGDDCNAAMCDEAKKLHSTYPNAKLSVLGIGMSEQPAANFTCAAKAMGGEFTAVKSATDLDKLLRQAFGVSLDGKPAKHSTAEAPPPEPGKSTRRRQEAGRGGSGAGRARRTVRARNARSRRYKARRTARAAG